jgi:hypothetical protein
MAIAYPLVVLAPLIGQGSYTLMHIAGARLLVGRSPYLPLVGAFLPGLLVTVAAGGLGLYWMNAGFADVIGYGALNIVTYGALGWGYFHFVNLCIASLRIRVLEEIVDAGGRMPTQQLVAHYNTDGLIAVRITRLVDGGHFVVRNQRYHRGKPQFLLIARIFDLLRRVIMGQNYLPLPETSAGELPPETVRERVAP